ncbi:MAG: M20/M25/M40 family metallo-hydrolase, partial [Phycisphaerales bacterium]|nr:M20/M25/M40 family metallo-hydrolase [Phycisphaerales bacterium]
MIDRVLEHLVTLVAADTSDPPSTVRREHPAIAYCVQVLEAFGCDVMVEDLGGGCVNVRALRGKPGECGVLFNCHLDTVRADPGWRRNPFAVAVEGGRAYGLGSCDIKGAAACLLSAAETTDQPLAVLLTTDEEGGKGRCIEHFLKTRGFDPAIVVVAEPTRCAAVAQHRGFASFEVTFRGHAGHSSDTDAASGSATHAAIRWAQEALRLAEDGLADSRFNIGIIEGGTASN